MLKAILVFSLASFVASDLNGVIDWAFLKYQVLTLSLTDPSGTKMFFIPRLLFSSNKFNNSG